MKTHPFSGEPVVRMLPCNVSQAVAPSSLEDRVDASIRQISAAMKPFDEATQRRLMLPWIEREQANLALAESQVANTKKCRERLIRVVAAIDELAPWLTVALDAPVLQKNDCSRLHLFNQAARDTLIIDGSTELKTDSDTAALAIVKHTFVLAHDWASALSKADDGQGDIRLPYDLCAFEFRICDRSVIAFANNAFMGHAQGFHIYFQTKEFWYSLGDDEGKGTALVQLVWDQIRAVCIALDAEVATADVIRAPHDLNVKREKAGKVPMLDHHVVNLARRSRVSALPGAATGRRVRLHFRRGHWRHYEEHKTWIKWMLVGNPDLGFIEKHYSL